MELIEHQLLTFENKKHTLFLLRKEKQEQICTYVANIVNFDSTIIGDLPQSSGGAQNPLPLILKFIEIKDNVSFFVYFIFQY